MATITITGLVEVQRRLEAAPSLLVAKAMHTALDRAIGVIAAEVEARTPEGDTGLLKESVITKVVVDLDRKGGKAACGFATTADDVSGAPQDLIAFWVEYGHRHVAKGGKEIGHVAPHPFMRPAFDSSKDKAVEVFTENLLNQLDVIEHG